MKKRWIALLLALTMLLGVLPVSALAGSALPFTDVKSSDWFYDGVKYVYENGLMSGTGTATFSPNTATTRGMIVTILHRMEGEPTAAGEAFTDVEAGQYYAAAVAWASANGIVGGYGDGTFGPNDPITREQLAAILYRYAQFKGMDVSVGENTNILSYTDFDQLSEWAIPAMQWACGAGLISGVGGGALDPQGHATRAQIATILMRFCEPESEPEPEKEPKPEPTPTPDTYYTVTFNSNGGTPVEGQTVKAGTTAEEPAAPAKDGYVFGGWFSDALLTSPFDFATPITRHITLYAKWVDEQPSDTLSVVINQGNFTTTDLFVTINGTISEARGIDRVAYDVASAYDSDSEYNGGVAVLGGTNWEFIARLKPGENTITVTVYAVDGRTASDSIQVTYDMGSISIPDEDEIDIHDGVMYRRGVLVIYFDRNISDELAREIIAKKNGTVIGQNNYLMMYQAKFDAPTYDDLIAIKEALEENEYVQAVTLEEIIENSSISVNDPWNGDVENNDWNDSDVDGSNWGLEAINIAGVWEQDERLAMQPSRIGVVDTGINLSHAEFSNTDDQINVALVNPDGYNYDGSNHGSHVTGTIAAAPDNGNGVAGAVWNTDLYFGSAGTVEGWPNTLIQDAFCRIVICGGKVVNFSAGRKIPTSSDAERRDAAIPAIRTMVPLLEDGFDFLFVQSAGNKNTDARTNGWFCAIDSDTDISAFTTELNAQDLIDHIIVVGAVFNRVGEHGYYLDTGNFTGIQGETTGYSNRGSKVDIVAPGTNIFSCYYNGTDFMSGTSMAAPHVTAVAGLMWSANNELTMTEIKDILCSDECTGEAYDYTNNVSYRMLDANLAVAKAFELADRLGSASGCFVDATNGSAVLSGSFIIHKETANGEVVETKSFSNGVFSFEAPAGRYVLEIHGDGGYIVRYLTVIIVPSDHVDCGDVALSKELDLNQVRIVLSWGENPSDLDSHIIGDTQLGNHFHVSYQSTSFTENNEETVWLDWDDVTSYGPETITVVDLTKIDSFKYCVHNYTYREDGEDDSGALSLADSGATVNVYVGNELYASYNVPVNRKGTVWEVFSMDSTGQITVINTMSFESSPSEVGEH